MNDRIMRYRIVLNETVHNYEAIIFRELQEQDVSRGLTITQKKLFALSEAYNKVHEEMKGSGAFTITQIAEAPEEIIGSDRSLTPQSEPLD